MTKIKTIIIKIPERLEFDLSLWRQKIGYNEKEGKTKCLLSLLEEILAQKMRLIKIEPLSYGNPLGCGIIPDDD